MKKNVDVMYFDYWSRGIRHFSKVDKVLKSKGLNSTLLHLGSLRGEPRFDMRFLDGIYCQDISVHNDSLVEAIKNIRPKVVLLLNNQTEDKILIRACRHLGIKTLFLMHGILPSSDETEMFADFIDGMFGVSGRLQRLPRYSRLFFDYLKASNLGGVRGIFDYEPYLYFVRHAISPGRHATGVWRYKDSFADKALVYSEDDKALFVNQMGYHRSDVCIVGNYNLDDLIKNLGSQNFETLDIVGLKHRYVLYVENGFSDPKYTVPGWSEELVSNEINQISKICEEFDIDIVLKLHPSSDYSTLVERSNKLKNVKVVLNCDLTNLIRNSKAVLGQSSSVLMMAAALNKPIGLLDIFPLNLSLFTFVNKGVGDTLQNEGQLKSFIKMVHLDAPIHNNDICKKENFIGPQDGMATHRISEAISGALDS